jgi:hypothetical protein
MVLEKIDVVGTALALTTIVDRADDEYKLNSRIGRSNRQGQFRLFPIIERCLRGSALSA